MAVPATRRTIGELLVAPLMRDWVVDYDLYSTETIRAGCFLPAKRS